MTWLLSIPLPVRLTVLFVVGACVASLLNAAVYAWAWVPRLVSPWQSEAEGVATRSWADRLPIVGWWRLRRDAGVLGRGFWVRPMLIELACGIGLTALYWWEVSAQSLVTGQLPFATTLDASLIAGPLHWQFMSHAILAALMVVATFIDIDEKTIPDEITWPGLWIGLLLATIAPTMLLPQVAERAKPPQIGIALQDTIGNDLVGQFFAKPLYLEPVLVTSPNRWPTMLEGMPNRMSLLIGLGCWWLWCFAVAYRPWRWGCDIGRNLSVCWPRFKQSFFNRPIRELILIGTLLIAMVWYSGGAAWTGLLSSLVGMVVGGGIVWGVRIVGSLVLGREAMGFGDVTLMMMIGAFVGWQPCLAIFFLAPFAGLVLGLLNLLLRSDHEIPYGPFLCAATAVVVVRWADLWPQMELVFAAGWLVPAVLVVCLVLLGVLLALLQLLKRLFGQ